MTSSEEMRQVLQPLQAKQGSLLQRAQLLVQYLREVACLWSEQWMHVLRDVQVQIPAELCSPLRISQSTWTMLNHIHQVLLSCPAQPRKLPKHLSQCGGNMWQLQLQQIGSLQDNG